MRRIIVILLITAAAGWAALRVAATSPIVNGNLVIVVAHPGDGEDDHLDPGTMIGVGTCARCHGEKEKVGESQKHWKSAYTAWINRDPHRRAFAVLYSARSVQIIKKLTAVDQQPISDPQTTAYESYLKDKCTACHATAQEEVEDYSGEVALDYTFRDGVSCESCHGAAAGWLEPHQNADGWKNKNDQELKELGFTKNKDLTVRADVCVQCHVGSEGGAVNHDLIAAGHPRLNFEFYYYMDRYAVLSGHWDFKAEQNKDGFFAKTWAIGQLASAKASLEVTQARAAGNSDGSVWPEFSEYGCFACHHDLEGIERHPGQPQWNSWYLTQHPFRLAGLRGDDPGSLDTIRNLMSKFALSPEARGTVAQLSIDLAKKLEAKGVAKDALLKAVTTVPKKNWDAVGQWFLALWAFRDQMHHDGVAASDLEQLDKRLEELRKLLDYPFGKPEQSKDLQDLDELVRKIVSEVNTVAKNPN